MTDWLYLLDTNIVSDLMKNPSGKVFKQIARVGEDKICTSVIVASELRYGAAKKGSSVILEKVEAILNELPVLPYEAPADRDYGVIRASLESAGQTIGSNDLLIAAHARSLGLTLVTDNVREFRKVRGLKVESWLRSP